MQKLSSHQEDTLKELQSEFANEWFTLSQCYPLPIRRTRFSVETLHEKGFLLKERNPNWVGPLLDNFHRYKVCLTPLAADLGKAPAKKRVSKSRSNPVIKGEQ